MASSLHLPGVGLRSGILGRRNLAEIQERDRQRTADTRWAVMVRSIGRGLHLVKDFCNDAQYVVGSAQGSLSYRPGQVVALMSSTGTPGEVIVAQPPPGRAGTSAFPVALSTRSTRFAVEEPEPPPTDIPAITGKTYIGVYIDTVANVLHAWLYADGEFQSVIGTRAYGTFLSDPPITGSWQRIHTLGDVLGFRAFDTTVSRPAIVTWTPATSAINRAQGWSGSGSFTLIGPVWDGGTQFYFRLESVATGTVQLRKVAVNTSAAMSEAGTQVGAPFNDADLDFPLPAILCYGGLDWQVPAENIATFPEIVSACPYFSGGAWNAGLARTLVDPLTPHVETDGWPVSGDRSARITRFATGELTVGILPAAPGSPELALIPAAWGVSEIGGISVPAGLLSSQVALYPFRLPDDPIGASDQLLRLNAQTEAYPENVTLHRITVEVGPNGELPQLMLCRD